MTRSDAPKVTSDDSEEPAEMVVSFEDGRARDGPGFYWHYLEYPNEGYCGAFETRAEAVAHCEEDPTHRVVCRCPDGVPQLVICPRHGKGSL